MATEHERALEALRRDAIERLAEIDRDLDALRALRRTESDDDEHDPDGVPLSEEWSRLVGLREGAVSAMSEIEAAIERSAAGDYGICEGCGEPIDPRRLAVRPFATRCVECAD